MIGAKTFDLIDDVLFLNDGDDDVSRRPTNYQDRRRHVGGICVTLLFLHGHVVTIYFTYNPEIVFINTKCVYMVSKNK